MPPAFAFTAPLGAHVYVCILGAVPTYLQVSIHLVLTECTSCTCLLSVHPAPAY